LGDETEYESVAEWGHETVVEWEDESVASSEHGSAEVSVTVWALESRKPWVGRMVVA
jgi:hypothetical protein